MTATIQEVMSRDPHDMSEEDMKILIETYRGRRGQFMLGNMQAGSTKVSAKEKEALSLAGKMGDLAKDLGL